MTVRGTSTSPRWNTRISLSTGHSGTQRRTASSGRTGPSHTPARPSGQHSTSLTSSSRKVRDLRVPAGWVGKVKGGERCSLPNVVGLSNLGYMKLFLWLSFLHQNIHTSILSKCLNIPKCIGIFPTSNYSYVYLSYIKIFLRLSCIIQNITKCAGIFPTSKYSSKCIHFPTSTARRNDIRYSTEESEAFPLIYNYKPIYIRHPYFISTYNYRSSFQQCYFFKNNDTQSPADEEPEDGGLSDLGPGAYLPAHGVYNF